MRASYLSLTRAELEERVTRLKNKLHNCDLCALKCEVDRLNGERGECESGENILISSTMLHFGEEKPLVGRNGSGTIFLANCNLSCVYCQNFEISQLGRGREISPAGFAAEMLKLQKRGCHNVNWVSPTHFVPQLAESLLVARDQGLTIPIVYNTGGYDNPEIIKMLDDIVDIYMPDMKYSNSESGLKYSRVPRYWEVNKKAVKEMHRQVGDLQIDEEGIATRGLLIRHLILPENLAGTEEILRFIVNEISTNSYVNIMDQYRPCWKASQYEELNRTINWQEYQRAVNLANKLELDRGL